MTNYKIQKFLNKKDSPSTSTVTAYCGKAPWKKHKETLTFFELSDCHSKIRLHKSDLDTDQDFILKLKKLRKVIDNFINHLEEVS